MEVPGYRVDEIEDWKTVEVEHWEEWEMAPRKLGVSSAKEKVVQESGANPGKAPIRRLGDKAVFASDENLDDIDSDNEYDGEEPKGEFMTDKSVEELEALPPSPAKKKGTRRNAATPAANKPAAKRSRRSRSSRR